LIHNGKLRLVQLRLRLYAVREVHLNYS
jgi:hypothetical protein